MLKDGTLIIVTPELRKKLMDNVNSGKQNIVKHEGITKNTLNMFAPSGGSGSGSATKMYKAVVSSGNSQSGYDCSLYDLLTGEYFGDGMVFPLQMAYNSTLPQGTVLLAHSITVKTYEVEE